MPVYRPTDTVDVQCPDAVRHLPADRETGTPDIHLYHGTGQDGFQIDHRVHPEPVHHPGNLVLHQVYHKGNAIHRQRDRERKAEDHRLLPGLGTADVQYHPLFALRLYDRNGLSLSARIQIRCIPGNIGVCRFDYLTRFQYGDREYHCRTCHHLYAPLQAGRPYQAERDNR